MHAKIRDRFQDIVFDNTVGDAKISVAVCLVEKKYLFAVLRNHSFLLIHLLTTCKSNAFEMKENNE